MQGPPLGTKPDFSKKPAPNVKVKGILDAARRNAGEAARRFIVSPLDKRPNAMLHAQYDKPGTPGPRLHAIVRQWQIEGDVRYSLETSRRDEFVGSKDDVISVFFGLQSEADEGRLQAHELHARSRRRFPVPVMAVIVVKAVVTLPPR